MTGLPTSVLGYDGSRPSGAFRRLGGGPEGTVEAVELVLLWLFSCSTSGGSLARESGLLPPSLL